MKETKNHFPPIPAQENNPSQSILTGHELIDGVYHIAPAYISQFEKLAARASAVDQSLKATVRFITELNEDIATDRNNLWKRVQEDLSLDPTKVWECRPDGTIREKKPRG